MGDILDKTPLFVSRYLDILYEIKFKLALKKIEGKSFISKLEFKNIIMEETIKDEDVRKAIDALFKPLDIFSSAKQELINNLSDANFSPNINEPQSINQLQNKIDQEIANAESNVNSNTKSQERGISKSLSLPAFKNVKPNSTEAA